MRGKRVPRIGNALPQSSPLPPFRAAIQQNEAGINKKGHVAHDALNSRNDVVCAIWQRSRVAVNPSRHTRRTVCDRQLHV
jgi:hypothetical protein